MKSISSMTIAAGRFTPSLSKSLSRIVAVPSFLAVLVASSAALADPPAHEGSAPAAATTDPPLADPPAASSVDPAAPPSSPAMTLTTASPSAVPNEQAPRAAAVATDVRSDVPVLALAHSAFGARSGKVGAHGFGYGTAASGGSIGGGGLTVYGSPFNRLTLLAIAERHADGRFNPSASLAYRILGSRDEGWALAAMGTYKAEGFAEMEGEVELAALLSFARDRWHLDFNGVVGGGLEESEEFDAEAKLRGGYDATDWLRVGLDSRARYRLRGDVLLVGGRKWDVIGGPQVTALWSQFYVSALVGASSVDVAEGVGGAGWLTAGGVLP